MRAKYQYRPQMKTSKEGEFVQVAARPRPIGSSSDHIQRSPEDRDPEAGEGLTQVEVKEAA
jgi:hypothetical protein